MLGTESTGKLLKEIAMNLRVLQIAEHFTASFERRTSLCEACISHLFSCLLADTCACTPIIIIIIIMHYHGSIL